MTEQQTTGLKRTCSIAGVGAAIVAIGLFTATPAAIASGVLVCCLGTFGMVILYDPLS